VDGAVPPPDGGDKSWKKWEKPLKKNKGIDGITEMFMRQAVDDGDPEHLVHVIGKIQEVLVAMFSLYIIMQGKEHEDHDCELFKALPEAIEDFKRQLIRDIDLHVFSNMKVNNITLVKTKNQKTYDEIMQMLNQAE